MEVSSDIVAIYSLSTAFDVILIEMHCKQNDCYLPCLLYGWLLVYRTIECNLRWKWVFA